MTMIIIFVSLFLLLLGGIGFVVFKITKNSKENKQEEEKHYNTTQNQLPFEYIRMGVVKLKNNVFAKVLEVPSINTQLMEEDERESVREIYASVLNSVNFNIQFYKQSRLIDIREYLMTLDEKAKSEDNPFKVEGINRYQNFVSTLVRENSVQTKKDYLVIPYTEEKKKIEKEDPNSLKKYQKTDENEISDESESIRKRKEFEKALKTLNQRVKTIEKQIRRLGISSYILKDEDLFELFYTTYNKDRSNNQSMRGVNPNDYTTMYVKKGEIKAD